VRAKSILQRVVGSVAADIHRARLRALVAAVLGLIEGGAVGLTALGRTIGSRSHKHGIKRVDRLLGNEALVGELDLLYRAIARYALGSTKRPVILLDWTTVRDAMCALTAAVPVQGRAVPIYTIACPLSDLANPKLEFEFLKRLRTMLPTDCRAVLVADAGFRAPWIRAVRELGFDYVTRIRGRTRLCHEGERRWSHWKTLLPQARRVPRALGMFHMTESRPVEIRLVVVDRRTRRARTSRTARRRNARAQRAVQAQREPWFLATSVSLPPAEVVALYATRMQIELTFRDLKSHRFGWAFEDARSRSVARVAIQMLLAAFASLVAMLLGLAAEAAGLHKPFQANTTKTRRVLSLVALGRQMLRAKIRLPPDTPILPIVGIP
jgi:hypothetical protein